VAMPDIALDSVVTAAKEQVSSDIGSEVAILGLRRHVYYSLDGVGKRVWELLQTPRTVADILEHLLDQYAVGRERCHGDLITLLRRMHEEGLIDIGAGTPQP
jgi:hypothetical protein